MMHFAHSKRQASHWYLCPAVYAPRLNVCNTINSWNRSPYELFVTYHFVLVIPIKVCEAFWLCAK